jgi:hypothetical protein
VDSSTAVNLASVGTLGWARWPGYSHKSNLISDVTSNGKIYTYDNEARLISGDGGGVKVYGTNSQLKFTAAATTTERTLLVYIGGWNSTSRLEVSLPGAPTYTAAISSKKAYDRVATIKYRADSNTNLTIRYTSTSKDGSIRLQAAALQGGGATAAPSPSPQGKGSAKLTWAKPTTNTNGSALKNLSGYKVYWGKTKGSYSNSAVISNPSTTTYNVANLAAGTWYFTVTSLTSDGKESAKSNVASKRIE